MVAGGGASVVYADTISDYGFGKVCQVDPDVVQGLSRVIPSRA